MYSRRADLSRPVTKEVETMLDSSSQVAYFCGADLTRPTLIMLLWAAIAAATVAIAARRQPRTRAAAAQPSRIPERAPVPADPRLSLGS